MVYNTATANLLRLFYVRKRIFLEYIDNASRLRQRILIFFLISFTFLGGGMYVDGLKLCVSETIHF